jgi:HAD superfamily hydrolase (TIGR01509 family)
MINAVIWDMDGVIVNSEPIQNRAFCWLLEREGKVPRLFPNGLLQEVGVRESDNISRLIREYGLSGEVQSLMKFRGDYYRKLLGTELKPMPGVRELMELIRVKGLLMAIASSSVRENIEIVLKALNLQELITLIVSGEEVKHGKPDPEIYLTAAKKLGVNTQQCLVLEDASTGVRAGKAAGMKVIAVPNEFTRDGDFDEADEVISSLLEVSWQMIENLG